MRTEGPAEMIIGTGPPAGIVGIQSCSTWHHATIFSGEQHPAGFGVRDVMSGGLGGREVTLLSELPQVYHLDPEPFFHTAKVGSCPAWSHKPPGVHVENKPSEIL